MNKEIKQKIIQVCDDKIVKKGTNVGLSFYAFFKNKNDNPELLMQVAKWWIETHQLDHFEKAVKIKKMIEGSTSFGK
jgi:mannitol-1-phosphate/altronate dehydrogenase